jgi:hypothetical protein
MSDIGVIEKSIRTAVEDEIREELNEFFKGVEDLIGKQAEEAIMPDVLLDKHDNKANYPISIREANHQIRNKMEELMLKDRFPKACKAFMKKVNKVKI